MSHLAAALSAFAAQPSAVHIPEHQQSTGTAPSAPASPSSSCSSALPSLTNSTCGSDTFASITPHLPPGELRSNEHLAVLLPKALWKPDSVHCDNFFCRVKFSLFERRHHCRKCGGVFCHSCSSRTTHLLDTSNLSFLHPPHNVPLQTFESPTSPILPFRVCDDCWEQIHGTSNGRTRNSPLSPPVLIRSQSLLSETSSLPTSTSTSPPCASPTSWRSLLGMQSLTDLRQSQSHTLPAKLPEASPVSERSFGELDAYPLRRSSAICKATGGGRWEPRQSPPQPHYRIPGGKAPFEIEMEKEEEAERLRRQNPIVRDGEFQYRFPRDPEPPTVTNWNFLSTF